MVLKEAFSSIKLLCFTNPNLNKTAKCCHSLRKKGQPLSDKYAQGIFTNSVYKANICNTNECKSRARTSLIITGFELFRVSYFKLGLMSSSEKSRLEPSNSPHAYIGWSSVEPAKKLFI